MFFFVCTIVVVCMFAVRWWMFYAYTLLAMRIHCFFFLSKRQTCDMHGWLCVCVPFIRPLDTGLLHLQIYASHATEIYRTSFILSHMFSKYISPENNNKRTNEWNIQNYFDTQTSNPTWRYIWTRAKKHTLLFEWLILWNSQNMKNWLPLLFFWIAFTTATEWM